MEVHPQCRMPEQLTKHPEVTMQVLASAGVSCGRGEPQQILTTCPAQRFCKLPGGELCIYGLPEATQMTQLSALDWQSILSTTPAPTPAPTASLIAPVSAALGIGVVLGFAAARLWPRRR